MTSPTHVNTLCNTLSLGGSRALLLFWLATYPQPHLRLLYRLAVRDILSLTTLFKHHPIQLIVATASCDQAIFFDQPGSPWTLDSCIYWLLLCWEMEVPFSCHRSIPGRDLLSLCHVYDLRLTKGRGGSIRDRKLVFLLCLLQNSCMFI